MIVRAADFCGPGAKLAVTHATVFERLKAGKGPQWLGDPRRVHTFTFTPDAARTVALLAHRPDAWNLVWHALTSDEPITGEAFVRLACERAGRPYSLRAAPGWLLGLLGLFSPILRENREMMYQFEYDYRFDSSKARRAPGVEPTGYEDGIALTLAA
jgi:nucleoside-diphosphate-sugar epimerase